jgi:signal transduction histidine kinase/ActR/RegA family two-component response regulator
MPPVHPILRHRLSLAFGLLVVISVASGLLALAEIAKVQRNLDQIVQQHNARLRLLHGMAESVHVESRVLPALIPLFDKAEIDSQKRMVMRARERYDAAWAALQALPAAQPQDRAEHAGILAADQRARQLNAEVIELARTGQDGEANVLLRAQAGPAAVAWLGAIEAAFTRAEADTTTAYGAAVDNHAEARALLLGISGLNVTMGLVFGGLLIRQRRQDLGLQQALKQARDSAEQATHAKSVFLANMSHEIRTPMNGVLGIAEMLAGTPLDALQRKYVTTIRRSGRSLMALLNDILDLSKVEAGRLELENRPIDLQRVLQASIDLMAPRAAQKGLGLALEIAENLNTWVMADAMRLQQAVNNLLSNAVKFTERGQVGLSLGAVPGLGAEGYRLCVIDTGPGILPQAIDKLFQPFSQADGSTTRKYGGTGLGLAIASQIVKTMGGTLTVDSTPGAGSTFALTLCLPAAPSHLQHLNAAESGFSGLGELEPAGATAPLTVLVVEDNPVNQIYCQAVLEQMGHTVQLADDGLQALQMATDQPYDLILMDCQMPVLDGFEATRRIRAQERQRGARRQTIVALTASATDDDRQRCHDAGMDDLLLKPYTRDEMARLLGRATAASAPIAAQAVVADPA